MPEPKGDKLYVNLGASQVRRRLKGFGHGVRKVHATGRNQAVIIHTATGRHLDELERKFADAGFSRAENELHEPIDNLRNLGHRALSAPHLSCQTFRLEHGDGDARTVWRDYRLALGARSWTYRVTC